MTVRFTAVTHWPTYLRDRYHQRHKIFSFFLLAHRPRTGVKVEGYRDLSVVVEKVVESTPSTLSPFGPGKRRVTGETFPEGGSPHKCKVWNHVSTKLRLNFYDVLPSGAPHLPQQLSVNFVTVAPVHSTLHLTHPPPEEYAVRW